jgi:dienelactone hydrolase
VGCPTLAVDFFSRVAWRFGDFDEQAPTVMLSLDASVLADDATSFRPADAQRLGEELEPAGTSVETFTYPGTRHGFLTDSRPDLFNAAAAELVWARTTALADLAAASSLAPVAGR